MDIYRYSGVFHVTTTPVNPTIASAHSGGWTENVWSFLTPAGFTAAWTLWFQRRAALLPAQAAIVGYRSQKYTLSGNKLIPGGATSGDVRHPGNAAFLTDLPQVALSIDLKTTMARNTADWKILCVPDNQMVGGEYGAVGPFPGLLNLYLAQFASGNFAVVGRDLTEPVLRVMDIHPHTVAGQTAIRFDGVMPAAVNDFVRLLRVKTDLGESATGTFRVVGNDGFQTLYVTGYKYGVLTNPNGFGRIDVLAAYTATSADYGRATIRKVGRPSESYRGRGSKRRR